MGLLSDLYISVPGKAADYDESGTAVHRAHLTGLTPLEFSTLWALIRSEPWEERHLAGFERVLERFGGMRTIHRIPDGFAHVAAALDPSDLDEMATRWAATDELACDPAEVRPALNDIVRLAGIARDGGQSLFLWNCI